MWTKKEVEQFLLDHPINTNGALAIHQQTEITEHDDGDRWFEVRFAWWWCNNSVMKDLLTLALDALNRGNATVYPSEQSVKGHSIGGSILIEFHSHYCNPD